MNVPFLDLKKHHEPLRAEIMAAIADVADQSAFAGGRFVTEFENDFAAFSRVKHAIGVGNGTDALWLALKALGVGEGDEVITVPNSFIATGEAISLCGAIPVFVDVCEDTMTMDPSKLEAAITTDTKAIIPVHLYGQMADMDPIMEIANKHKIPVIEDACQAHGAEYKGRRAGSIGVFGAFSFYPGKNLGAWGEGGAITTNDSALAEKVRVFREHGQEARYFHSVIGWNARMDGIQAAVLRIKLRHLDKGNALRRQHAERYLELLSGVEGVTVYKPAAYGTPVYHLFVVQIDNRNDVIKALSAKGIGCAIHYPKPIHLQKAYDFLGHTEGSFPVAERSAERLLSLPMYPELTDEQIRAVVSEFAALIGAGKQEAVAASA